MFGSQMGCSGAKNITSRTQVKLGPGGIEEFLPLGSITPYERSALTEAISILQGNITKGIEFANQA